MGASTFPVSSYGDCQYDLIILVWKADEPLWIKSAGDGREILNLENYERIFPRPNHLKSPDIHIEATRDSGHVIMNALALVEMFMDSNKWMELFPTIISNARTIKVLAPEMAGNRSGSLQLWEVVSTGNSVREVAHIANGSHPGSCISVLRVRMEH